MAFYCVFYDVHKRVVSRLMFESKAKARDMAVWLYDQSVDGAVVWVDFD